MSVPREVCEIMEHRWIEAIEWHALRCSATVLTPEQQADWQRWWQDGENRRIYGSCARLHVDAQQLHTRASTTGTARATLDRSTARSLVIRPLRRLVGAVTLGAAIACVFLLFRRYAQVLRIHAQAAVNPPTLYRTGPGQTQRIRLRDGSTVILGAGTALTVTLSPRRRTVRLAHGEAWFRVTHRFGWPFVVKAGPGTITDLGTAFVVDREPHRVEVTVTEGRVEIALRHLVAAPHLQGVQLEPVRLHRGERLSYGTRGVGAVRTVDPRVALAWTTGELEFSDEPLRDVLANVSRYAPQPITATPAAGGLRVTTLVFSRDVSEWLDGLTRVLPVTVERTDVGICVRLRTHNQTQINNACTRR